MTTFPLVAALFPGDMIDVRLTVVEDAGTYVCCLADAPGLRQRFWLARSFIVGIAPAERH